MRGSRAVLVWMIGVIGLGAQLIPAKALTPTCSSGCGSRPYVTVGTVSFSSGDGFGMHATATLTDPAAKKGLTTGKIVIGGRGVCTTSPLYPIGPPTVKKSLIATSGTASIVWANGQLSGLSLATRWQIVSLPGRSTGVGQVSGKVNFGPYARQPVTAVITCPIGPPQDPCTAASFKAYGVFFPHNPD